MAAVSLNPLDATLQAACPALMYPRYGGFVVLDENADTHRFLICGDGIYVEIRRKWLHAILKVSDVSIPLPYGTPTMFLNIYLDRTALAMGLRHFIRRAQEASPIEHAAWLTFDPDTKAVGYVEPEVISRGGAHIQYHRPEVRANNLPVVDCHSHGRFAAGFSDTDEADDVDDAKLAFVVGNLDTPVPSIAARFVGFGFSQDLSDWARRLAYDLCEHDEAGEGNG